MKHLKPKSGVRLHFAEVTDEGGSKKAQCTICSTGPGKTPWQTVPDATRMAKHLLEKHRIKPEPLKDSPSSSISPHTVLEETMTPPRPEGQSSSQLSSAPCTLGLTPAKKQKTVKVSDYLDRPFAEQLATERDQALALVLGVSAPNLLTCSQSSVERVFSAADWAASNRERICFEKPSRAVKLRKPRKRDSDLFLLCMRSRVPPVQDTPVEKTPSGCVVWCTIFGRGHPGAGMAASLMRAWVAKEKGILKTRLSVFLKRRMKFHEISKT